MNKKKIDLSTSLGTTFTIRKHLLLLIIITLLINLSAFLVSKRSYFCSGLIAPHAEVAYNVYAYNSLGINTQRLEHVLELQRTQQRLIEYHELNQELLSLKPDTYRSVNDTIGYGVLLGLLWKCTHSLSYNDIRHLQIVLLCVVMLYLYAIGLLLFNNPTYVFISCLIFLSLHAVVFINVRALRDAWGLYGLILLVYDFLSYYYAQRSVWSLRQVLHCLLFGLCVWLRPTIMFTLLGFGALCWSKRLGRLWLMYCMSILLLFWLPFCLYNKHAYKAYVVSCAGHDLLAGLGEFNNPWGIKLCDTWVANDIYTKYGYRAGTTAYDSQCTQEFMHHVKEQPLVYCKQLLRRSLQLMIFYGMIHEWQEYDYCLQKANSVVRRCIIKGMEYLDYAQRLSRFGCWYILLGWIGIGMMLMHRRYYEVLLFVICALSGASKFLSHLETRYLIAHYAFFCFAIMYLGLQLHKHYKRYRSTAYS